MAETAAGATERIQILLDLEKDAHDKAARASAREIVKLEKAYDPLARATLRYKQETDKLATALQKGTITERRHTQLLEKVQAEYDQTASRLNRLTAAQNAYTGAGSSVFASMNRNKQAFQQLGYQVGDFAVQVGSGTSALTAFAQQGSQVLGFLGPWGALAGAAVAITVPLAAAFWSAKEGAEDFSDTLKDLNDEMIDLQDQLDLLRSGLDTIAQLKTQQEINRLIAERAQLVADMGDMDNRQQRNARGTLGVLDEQIASLQGQLAEAQRLGDQYEGLENGGWNIVRAVNAIDFSGAISQGQTFAGILAEAAGNAWSMAQARAYHGLNISGGRGADPRQFGGSFRDWQQNNPYPVFSERAGNLPQDRPARSTSPGASGADRVEREAQQAAAAYERLMRALDPLRAVTGEYADNLKVLNEALGAGKITNTEYAASMELVDQAHEKALADLADSDVFKNLRDDVEGLTESLLRTAVAGGSVGDSLRNFLLDTTLQAAAQNLTSAIFGASGTTGGGLFGSLASAIFGQRAGGGGARAGVPYLVNEGTPNSEVFVPSRSGGILNVPQAQAALAKSGGMSSSTTTITQPISIDARGAQAGVAEQIAQQIERIRPQMQADAVTAVYRANRERPLR